MSERSGLAPEAAWEYHYVRAMESGALHHGRRALTL